MPVAWRCDDSDGCMDFQLLITGDLDKSLAKSWTFTTAAEELEDRE